MKNTIRILGLLNIAITLWCYGSNAYAVGATTPFTTVEAESGTIAGGATIVTFSGSPGYIMSPQLEASGRAYVALTGTGQSVTWTNNTGKSITAINVRGSVPPAPNRTTSAASGSPNTFTLDLYVNGTLRQAISLNSKQTWLYEPAAYGFVEYPVPSAQNPVPHIFWDEMHTFITGAAIAPGSTIMLKQDAANTSSFYYIDCIDLEAPPAALTAPAGSLSITSYGAVANNSSVDNSTDIQNCINAAKAAGVVAWIPSGTFYINNMLDASNAMVEGAGMWYSQLYCNPAGGFYTTSSSTSSLVQNLFLDSSGDGATTGFSPSGSNWMLNNVWIEHHGEGAVWASGTNGTVQNCRFNNTFGDGININNGNQGGVIGNNLTVQNIFVRGSTDDCIAINSENGTSQQNMQNSTVINNTVVTPEWGNCIGVYGGINDLVQGNLCTDGVQECGIDIGVFGGGQPLVSGTVQGNTITRCGSWVANVGLGVGATSSTGAPLVSNVFVGSNTVLNSFFTGIGMGGVVNSVMQGNTVQNSTDTGISIGGGAIGGSLALLANTVTGEPSGQVAFLNQSSPVSNPISNLVNAASYNSANSVGTETCSEGGVDVEGITNGSYTVYSNVNLTDDLTFAARVASAGSGGNIQVRMDSPTGTLLGTATVPVTGGWQSWTMVNCALTGASGYHNLYLVYTGSSGYLFNVEWFTFFANVPVTTASNYSSMSNVSTENCAEGGLDVCSIINGAYTVYNNVNLNGATNFYARVADAGTTNQYPGMGGNINIHLDSPTGTQIGTCTVTSTGGWQTWTTVNCTLSGASGTHNLYLVYTGPTGNLFNVEWFTFVLPTVGATEGVSYNSASSGILTETCVEGGLDVQSITNGSYTVYNDVNMTSLTSFKARVADAGTTNQYPGVGGNINIHLDSPTGTLVGTCTVTSTGGWQTWTMVNCTLTPSTGFHNLYLVYTGPTGYLFNLEWFDLLN
jgi:hypothetical protein